MQSLISNTGLTMIQKQNQQFRRLEPYSIKPTVRAARCQDAWRAAPIPLNVIVKREGRVGKRR